MVTIEIDIYQCKHCAGAVKKDDDRCPYCGYYFKPLPVGITPKVQEQWPMSEVVKSGIYIEYGGQVVEINGMVEYATSTPMTYIHGISGRMLGIHSGPPDTTVRLSTIAAPESLAFLRALYQSNDYFNVLSTRKENGVPEVVFERCKIGTMMTKRDTRGGIDYITVEFLLRTLRVKEGLL